MRDRGSFRTRIASAGFLAAILQLTVGAVFSGIAATLTVTSVSDSGPGSLRQAILDANATNGLDTIVFQIPGSSVHTIVLLAALPTIADAIVIDGTTQPGFTNKPVIEINGNGATLGSVAGLKLSAGNSTIRGLVINRCGGAGIHLQVPGGSNQVQGNFIGTDATGAVALGNGQSGSGAGGLWIDGSTGNWIGGPEVTSRNLISGNAGPGIMLQNGTGNLVQGNLIGTAWSGNSALGNANNGVSLYNAARNQIGTAGGSRNVISGNGGSGVYLDGSGSVGNLIQGNIIGASSNGIAALPNAGDGVTVNGAAGNLIGGTNNGAGNVISGSSQGGVGLKNAGADGNVVQGNLIGTDVSGRLALANVFSVVTIAGGRSNLIGGTSIAGRNIISANKLSGVYLTTNSVGNLVQGNFVGVDITGTNGLGNGINGISVEGANANVIGGASADARNIISANTNYGIEIFSITGVGNAILGNYIGTSVTGQGALSNRLSGIHILSSGNSVGGLSIGAGNVISGNGQDGVLLEGASARSNLVQGNLIGTTASGAAGLGNGRAGVGISGAPRNLIGGTAAGAGNLISANGDAGIYLLGGGARENLIQGNSIGTDAAGVAALGNAYEGIYAERAATNTIGGADSGAGNLVSGNQTRGIWFTNASWNVVQGNWIGTQRDGISGLGNAMHGLECEVGACNNMIGGDGSAGNWIAFAGGMYAGVRIRVGSTNNAILGNAIFGNGALGIDLGVVDVTPNDPCDIDGGANRQQNSPVLSQAVSGNGIGIRGTLNSQASSSFVLQFFANPTCDSSGYGEGQFYLGQKTVVTSNNCNVSFMATFPGSLPTGYSVTATATDSAKNTSEFSACASVTLAPTLTIRTKPNVGVNVGWTNTTSGFALKQTDSLSSPVHWTAVTNNPILGNGQFVVTMPATNASRFYVLSFE